MQTVRTRVEKLERRMRMGEVPGQLVVARCGSDMQELDDLLASRGIERDDARHTIVVLRTLYEDPDGGISDTQSPTTILSMTELR